MATRQSSTPDSDEPSFPPGTVKLVQVRSEPKWQWRNCRLANGVWEPDDDGWNDGTFGAKSPGLCLTTGKRVSGPPQNTWSGAWGNLVVPPPPAPIASATALLAELKKEVRGQEVHEVILEREEAKHGRWPNWVEKLKSRGVLLEHAKPFRHQAEALQEVHTGNHVVIGTGTASGKSLCFQLPILRTLLAEPTDRAIYVSPMKALCADQLEAWADLLDTEVGAAHHFDASLNGQHLRVLRYDGDVKQQTIEHAADARVVLTNSSMLHYMLAAAEKNWRSLFSTLRYVVFDEVHTARGVTGANIAWIIRRLRRAAWRLSGGESNPQFVFCSATIGNPEELARTLIGNDDQRPISSVSRDTSGRARRVFVSWVPRVADDGLRRVTVLPDLVQKLLDRPDGPIQTIAFHRSRPEANLVARQCADRLRKSGRDDLANSIEAFIAMLTSEKKIQILDALRNGDCPTVFATSALELGIDIGNLSAAIIMGIPFSRTGFRQMAGRVGRRPDPGREAIVLYIPREDPLHDWYAKKEQFEIDLVRAEPEAVPTDPDNAVISRRHLIAAAKELQPTEKDGRFFGVSRWKKILAELKETGKLRRLPQDENCLYWVATDEDPHKRINVLATRGNCEVQVKRKSDGAVIGQTDNWSALWMLFPGAIYFDGIHDTYVVESLHLGALDPTGDVQHAHGKAPVAWVRKAKGGEPNCFTIAEQAGDVKILDGGSRPEIEVGDIPVYHGNLTVSTQLGGYYAQVRLGKPGHPSAKFLTERKQIPKAPTAIDADGNQIEYPKLAFETEGLWFRLPAEFESELVSRANQSGLNAEEYVLSCMHGAEHVILKMTSTLPGFCEDDLSGLSFGDHEDLGGPWIFVYESSPGGSGLVERLLQNQNLASVFQNARDQVKNCKCKSAEGCPLCVLARLCGNANSRIDKEGSLHVLKRLTRKLTG